MPQTFNDKIQAEKAAKDLLSKLNGTGWKIEVWNNLGWTYSAVNNLVTVYPSITKDHFCCLIGHTPGSGGYWSTGKSFNDPNEAVKHELKACQKAAYRVRDTYESALLSVTSLSDRVSDVYLSEIEHLRAKIVARIRVLLSNLEIKDNQKIKFDQTFQVLGLSSIQWANKTNFILLNKEEIQIHNLGVLVNTLNFILSELETFNYEIVKD